MQMYKLEWEVDSTGLLTTVYSRSRVLSGLVVQSIKLSESQEGLVWLKASQIMKNTLENQVWSLTAEECIMSHAVEGSTSGWM